MLFGLDSVHGANYVDGATIFPHQINAAATFNRTAAMQMGYVTAKDTRAAGNLLSAFSVSPLQPSL